jgi:hypothetical protein
MEIRNVEPHREFDEFYRLARYILQQLQILYPIEGSTADEHLAFLVPNYDGFLDEKLGHRQGCVWLRSQTSLSSAAEPAEEIELAVVVSSQIVATVLQERPMERLSLQSAGATMVLIEELSHLHLILGQSNQLSELSQTKLELQAEIDKVLITTLLLYNQTGMSHWLPVVSVSFDYHRLSPASDFTGSHYIDANSIAARFWYSWVRHLPDHYHPMLTLQGLTLLRDLQRLGPQYLIDLTHTMSKSSWHNIKK